MSKYRKNASDSSETSQDEQIMPAHKKIAKTNDS